MIFDFINIIQNDIQTKYYINIIKNNTYKFDVKKMQHISVRFDIELDTLESIIDYIKNVKNIFFEFELVINNYKKIRINLTKENGNVGNSEIYLIFDDVKWSFNCYEESYDRGDLFIYKNTIKYDINDYDYYYNNQDDFLETDILHLVIFNIYKNIENIKITDKKQLYNYIMSVVRQVKIDSLI